MTVSHADQPRRRQPRMSVATAASLYEAELDRLEEEVAQAGHARTAPAYLHIARLEYGNVCYNLCRHCVVARRPAASGAVQLSPEEMHLRAAAIARLKPDRIHLVGGANPRRSLRYFLGILEAVNDAAPGIAIAGLAPQHVGDLAALECLPAGTVLSMLHHAGLRQLTGEGAEIFAARVRDALCPRKITGGRWLQIMREAHEVGISSAASMTFGYTETAGDKAEHLALLQDLHEETKGFSVYWPEGPDNGYRTRALDIQVTPQDLLREIALGRLMLDPSLPVQCRVTPSLGPEATARAAAFGASEIAFVTRFDVWSEGPTAANEALRLAAAQAN